MTVGGLTMMIFMSAKLTLTMMAIVPPIAAGAVVYGGFLKRLATQTQSALADIQKRK
jgi:ABC-type multidrug transport system fused ATPase/permease subunit